MDAGVKDKILSRPRGKEWANWSVPDLSLEEVRRKLGGANVSDEELVLRVIAGDPRRRCHARGRRAEGL